MRKIFFTLVCLLSTLSAFAQGNVKVNDIILPSKYPLVGSPAQLKGQIRNMGGSNITSFQLHYTVNGGSTVSASINTSIGTGSIVTVSHPTFWTPSSARSNAIKMWVTDINVQGGANSSASNGEANVAVSTASQVVDKHVLMEYYSGEWCGWCPDGALTISNIKNEFGSKVIASTIHQGDFMQNNSGTAMISGFGINGYPSGTVDRKSPAGGGSEVMNRGDFRDAVAAQLVNTPQTPIGIDIEHTYNCNTRELIIKVNADFYTVIPENMRMSFFVQEDVVIGQGQRNFLNTTAGHPYQGLGDPIPNYNHKDVYRGTTGSVFGTAIGAITTPRRVSQIYTFVVPATGFDLNRLYIVGVVSKDGTTAGQREVFNVRRVKVDASKHMLSFFDKGDSYVNKTVTIPFTTAGCPTDPTVTVSSSNTAVLGSSNFVVSGTGLNRVLTINTGTTTGITNVTVTSTSGATVISRTFQYIVQDQTTSVEDQDIFAEVKVYPNPSNRFVEVDLAGLNAQKIQFSVLDLQGKSQTISKPTIQDNRATLDLKGLKSGMYLLEISNEKGKAIRKIIKE